MIHLNHNIARMAIAALLVATLAGCQSTSPRSQTTWQGDSFDEAIGRPPTARTLNVMAEILTGQGKVKQAEYVLKRIIHDYPNEIGAYNNLAALQMNSNRMAEAVETLSTALGQAPTDAATLNNLGMCYLRMGEVEMSLSRFRAASQNKPGEAKYVANEAVALGWLGQYDQAYTAFASILPVGESHYNVAVLSESREDYARAAEEFVKAHQNDELIVIEEDLVRVGNKLAALEGTGVETLPHVGDTQQEVTTKDAQPLDGSE